MTKKKKKAFVWMGFAFLGHSPNILVDTGSGIWNKYKLHQKNTHTRHKIWGMFSFCDLLENRLKFLYLEGPTKNFSQFFTFDVLVDEIQPASQSSHSPDWVVQILLSEIRLIQQCDSLQHRSHSPVKLALFLFLIKCIFFCKNVNISLKNGIISKAEGL